MMRFRETERPSFIELAKIVVTKNVGQTTPAGHDGNQAQADAKKSKESRTGKPEGL